MSADVVDTSVWIELFAGRYVPPLEEALSRGHVAQCALDRGALLLSRDTVFTRIAHASESIVQPG